MLTYLLSSLLEAMLTGDRLCDGGEPLDVAGDVIGELGVDDLSDENWILSSTSSLRVSSTSCRVIVSTSGMSMATSFLSTKPLLTGS